MKIDSGLLPALLFWSSVIALAYVYWGYGALLRLLAPRHAAAATPGPAPSVCVLLTVHNEAGKIRERLLNLAACEYPRDRFEVVVASDGSSDGTDDLAREPVAGLAVRVVPSGGRLGKSGAQNVAMKQLGSDVVVLTDADTRFAADFIAEVAAAFARPEVGCVTAGLRFGSGANGVAEGQGYYWRYELALRDLESRLGVLAVASGQAMAVRRELLRPLPEDVGDDCIIPLDVVSQGSRVVHRDSARAFDVMESEPEREFRTRVRMTLRNWVGTWRYPALLNPLRHPGYAFALWSHKLLRWLSPAFLLLATVSVAWLAPGGSPVYAIAGAGALLFYVLGALGWAAQRNGRRLPVASAIFGFLLANAGFLVGVLKAVAGRRVVTYRSGL